MPQMFSTTIGVASGLARRASGAVLRPALGGVLALGVVAGAALLLPASVPSVLAAPEPDPVPRKWQLTVDAGALRVMQVTLKTKDGTPDPRQYYVLTYKVSNNTGQDLLFTPSFELATDEGDLMRSGRDVPAEATKAILDMLENPLMQDQVSIVGMLLQGEENAKDGVAIWPVPREHVRQLEVYANGFSGETQAMEVFDAATKTTKRVLLRKTLQLRYTPLGEVQASAEPLPVQEQRWIMR
jgi:hypothetical protein